MTGTDASHPADRPDPLSVIIGGSWAVERHRQELKDLTGRARIVLLRGERGSGKTLAARMMYEVSGAVGHLNIVDPLTFGEERLETELFGIVHSGENGPKCAPGAIAAARDGMLVIREIANCPKRIQARLAECLRQPGSNRKLSYRPVCDDAANGRRESVDCTMVFTTSQNLEDKVRVEEFSQDLLDAIRVCEVRVPSIRDRGGDRILIARHFLSQLAKLYGREIVDFTAESIAAINEYWWPTNATGIRQVVESAMIRACADPKATQLDVTNSIPRASAPSSPVSSHAPTLADMICDELMQGKDPWAGIFDTGQQLGVCGEYLRDQIDNGLRQYAVTSKGKTMMRNYGRMALTHEFRLDSKDLVKETRLAGEVLLRVDILMNEIDEELES